jgi:UDP-glucuronate 4-epimerase
MALFSFTRDMLAGRPIKVFNHGRHKRDFTYIDDIVDGVIRVLDKPPATKADGVAETPTPGSAAAPYRIYNIGNQRPVELLHYIEVLEQCLGVKAERELLPLQPGDVPDTWADVSDLVRDFSYRPDTSVETGIRRFVDWYRSFYHV